jgi:hypothetical protein
MLLQPQLVPRWPLCMEHASPPCTWFTCKNWLHFPESILIVIESLIEKWIFRTTKSLLMKYSQSALCIPGFHIHGFNQSWIKNSQSWVLYWTPIVPVTWEAGAGGLLEQEFKRNLGKILKFYVKKKLKKNYLCTEQVQTFFSPLFPKQHNIGTICIPFTLYYVL